MNCTQCNNEILENAKFCSKCGQPASSLENQKVEKEKSGFWDQAIHVGSIIAGFLLGKFLGLVIFVFIFAYWIGEKFPEWYLKRDKINIKLIKIIVWSNIFTWLLPPLGIMTGFAALNLGNYFPGDKEKYKILATIGIILSFLNSFFGMLG